MDSHVFAKSSSSSAFYIPSCLEPNYMYTLHSVVLISSGTDVCLADHYGGNKLMEHKVWQLHTIAIPNITAVIKTAV